MTGLVSALCNRRYTERTVGYAESHDQALVGDQTLAFRLIGAEMYTGMSALTPPSPVVARGVALHAVMTLTQVLDSLVSSDRLPPAKREEVLAWVASSR